MAISSGEIFYARRTIGDKPNDAVLTAIYDRYVAASQTQPIEWAILEVLEVRYANMVSSPSSFTIPGDYGQTTGAENLKALASMIERQRAYMESIGLVVPGGEVGAMTVVLPEDHVYHLRTR